MFRPDPPKEPEPAGAAFRRIAKIAERFIEEAPEELPEPPESHDEYVRRLGIPKRYWRARIEDFDPAELSSAGAPWRVRETASDLRIVGPNGSGKTHLACALAELWGGHFRKALRVALEIRATFRSGSDRSELAIVEALVDLPVLVLDDVLAPKSSDFWLSTLLYVLDARHDLEKPTIVTCDRTLEQIDELDSSIASRMSAWDHVKINAGDRRMWK